MSRDGRMRADSDSAVVAVTDETVCERTPGAILEAQKCSPCILPSPFAVEAKVRKVLIERMPTGGTAQPDVYLFHRLCPFSIS
jgi:hypothetical protein